MEEEERNQINMMVSYEGKEMTLLELLQKRKSMYATSVRNLKSMKVDKNTEFLTLANLKYKEKSKRFCLDFYPPEMDMYEHLQAQPKKQTYIKDLIRADMEKNK